MGTLRSKGTQITRKSAGIPSIMIGILAANPDGPLFKRAVQELTDAARQSHGTTVAFGGPLPQVHALNCLKAIFIHGSFGSMSQPYVPPALDLAATCLTSSVWPIRNCGLVLFRALIDRLLPLSVSESQNWSEEAAKNTARIPPKDNIQLFKIVLVLLGQAEPSTSISKASLEGVFVALKIIQRIPPPFELREELEQKAWQLCSNAHWHVRDMAARTMSSLWSGEDFVEVVARLMPSLEIGQNTVHGRLLSISYILKSHLRIGTVSFESMSPSIVIENQNLTPGSVKIFVLMSYGPC